MQFSRGASTRERRRGTMAAGDGTWSKHRPTPEPVRADTGGKVGGGTLGYVVAAGAAASLLLAAVGVVAWLAPEWLTDFGPLQLAAFVAAIVAVITRVAYVHGTRRERVELAKLREAQRVADAADSLAGQGPRPGLTPPRAVTVNGGR